MLVALLFSNWLPERVLEVIAFGVFAPLLWCVIGNWLDDEYGLGRAHGRVPPPLRERPVTLSIGISVVILLGIRFLGGFFSPRFVGVFWLVLVPVSILIGALKWRRKYLPPDHG